VTDNHLTAERVTQIIEDRIIMTLELEHVRTCPNCNGWLRVFAAVASADGKKMEFDIPPAPDSK
jgi:hypothetical protein